MSNPNPTPVAPREVALIGTRPAQDRPWVRRLGWSAAAAAVLAVGAPIFQSGSFNPAHWSAAQGPEQTVEAQVVAKMMNTQGSHFDQVPLDRKGETTWQPAQDMESAAYRLVLFIPNELRPAVVAVSKDVYDRYCNHLTDSDYLVDSRTKLNTDQFAPCGTQYGFKGEVIKKVDRLDTVTLSFTRSKIDDSYQLTALEGDPKLAQNKYEKDLLARSDEFQRSRPFRSSPRG